MRIWFPWLVGAFASIEFRSQVVNPEFTDNEEVCMACENIKVAKAIVHIISSILH